MITDVIMEFVKEDLLSGQAMDLDLETPLFSGRLVDSVKLVELSVFLEDEFGIKVAASDIDPANIDSVKLIAEFVERKKG